MTAAEITARRAALDADPTADAAYCGLYRDVLRIIAEGGRHDATALARAALGRNAPYGKGTV